MFDLSRHQLHLEPPDGGKPKWFGHRLLLPPDTEMRRQPPGAAEQVVGPGTARHRQRATRPTYLGLAQRRRRDRIRTLTGFKFENNPGPESSHGHLARGVSQSVPIFFGTKSPTSNAPDHRTRLSAGSDRSDLIRSPRAVLTDTVVCLQMEME